MVTPEAATIILDDSIDKTQKKFLESDYIDFTLTDHTPPEEILKRVTS